MSLICDRISLLPPVVTLVASNLPMTTSKLVSCTYIQFKYAHTLSHTYTQVMEQLLRFSIQPVLSTESSQYERLGGLYLAYTLHSSQPCQQPQAVVGDYNLY